MTTTMTGVSKRLITVDDYDKMIEAGVFMPEERLELIEGELIQMSPIGQKHIWCVIRLERLLQQKISFGAFVSTQNPIHLGERSEPQPDLVLISLNADQTAKPAEKDILLVIEVSDTTLAYDRNVKLPLYARLQLPETWIVNLEQKQIEVYRNPSGEGYGNMQIFKSGETVSPLRFPDANFAVTEILGEE